MSARPVLDVSDLPHHGFDTVDTIWWGNNFLLAIETSMFGILIATYFYLRQNIDPWPPPLAQLTAPLNPLPDLGYGTANVILLLLSCIPMIWVDRSARRGSQANTQRGLVICLLLAFVAIILRSFEFGAVKFRWDSNAYGSVVWFILGMHLLHLVTLTCETMLLAGWSLTREFDMKHRVDITALAVYWYWVVGIWLVLYAVIYWAPRVG
ncbi:MAG TPA: cytochrome c oxidase subunit 3 [Pyrinomonadaceae bacterium]|jgi:heme/copper-type cytochrome/quinol oxidase subunit 3|nr:cytochrome c oxidase subunit 3 [Pyrinomonadaceae bacterium]